MYTEAYVDACIRLSSVKAGIVERYVSTRKRSGNGKSSVSLRGDR